MNRSGLIESPYITATRTRFVQPGKIEIDANERAVIEKRSTAFSFAPSSILSLTIFRIPEREGRITTSGLTGLKLVWLVDAQKEIHLRNSYMTDKSDWEAVFIYEGEHVEGDIHRIPEGNHW